MWLILILCGVCLANGYVNSFQAVQSPPTMGGQWTDHQSPQTMGGQWTDHQYSNNLQYSNQYQSNYDIQSASKQWNEILYQLPQIQPGQFSANVQQQQPNFPVFNNQENQYQNNQFEFFPPLQGMYQADRPQSQDWQPSINPFEQQNSYQNDHSKRSGNQQENDDWYNPFGIDRQSNDNDNPQSREREPGSSRQRSIYRPPQTMWQRMFQFGKKWGYYLYVVWPLLKGYGFVG